MRGFLIVLLWLAGSASAGSVYKCEDANGNPVFTQTPCSDDAEVLDMDDAQKVASLDMSPVAVRARDSHQCRKDSADIKRQFADSRQSINREMRQTRYNISRSTNNVAGASWSGGLEAKLGSLTVALEENRSDERRALSEHKDDCRDRAIALAD